jgi:hypothetical protein
VCKLKAQPKLVQYYHAAGSFPTKPSWLNAIKNKQYVSWPGLTWEVANKHYPESKETIKGHGCKTRSKLRSTETAAASNDNNNNDNNDHNHAKATHIQQPVSKQK